ncbi:MAG: 4Fe-4S dicluster domain-containing protein [Thermoproteales archaeon]|nr:4Fe-4S dicluster domain-containing protein [Thermoproteales archaeon]RLE65328.1 MAG: ferredoxin [Thermoprotei archaeon]
MSFMPKIIGGVIKQVLRRPVTRKYPLEKSEPSEGFRGRMEFYPELCMGCGLCERDCPTGAIKMEFYPNVKRRMPKFYYGLCIFCYQCIDSCAWNAIKPTTRFELSTYNKEELRERVPDEEAPPLKPRKPEKRLYFR